MRPIAAIVWATIVVALASLPGCVHPALETQESPTIRLARIEIINDSACDWNVTLTPSDSRAPTVLLIPALETVRTEFVAGPYSIAQAALTRLEGPDASRVFSMQFQPGENYRWRLTTLLTASLRAPP